MSETLQTRTEHSRSLEDAEKYKALETLKEVGLLIPVTDLETYHGRVRKGDEDTEWTIDPKFANGGNDSGNSNLNGKPTLYTAKAEVANEFAEARKNNISSQNYRNALYDRVVAYSDEENQEWLARENAKHQAWYDGLDEDQKSQYGHLTDENGTLKPKRLEDLPVMLETRRFEREGSPEEIKTLQDYASEGLHTELHEIVVADSDATIINFDFDDSDLEDDEYEKYQQALRALAIPVTMGAPVDFQDRDDVEFFNPALQTLAPKGYIEDDDVKTIAAKAGMSESLAMQLASGYNTRLIMQSKPLYLVGEMLKRGEKIFSAHVGSGDNEYDIPVNLEYAERAFHEAHIVGVRQRVKSATIHKTITSVSFFDLHRISTEESLSEDRAKTQRNLGGIAAALSRSHEVGELNDKHPLLKLLANPYAKPDKLVAEASHVEGFRQLFEASAGNHEGYTLAEHTEAVLRNFDENYADQLPVELLAPMRLAILSHDTGKPVAAARGDKLNQTRYNVAYAGDFMDKVGIDEKLKALIIALIGKGEELAFRANVRGQDSAKKELQEFAREVLTEYCGEDAIPDGYEQGFIEMCAMLQVCDGGAYTSMAITSRQGNKGRYRNFPAFNATFKAPSGLGKRDLKLR